MKRHGGIKRKTKSFSSPMTEKQQNERWGGPMGAPASMAVPHPSNKGPYNSFSVFFCSLVINK